MQIGNRSTGGLIKITVSTGGTGYTAPPTVVISGGGGSGATAYAHMAGTVVSSVVIGAAGSGYTASPTISFTGGGGTGAAATALAHTAGLRPMSFFKGRYSDMYGVDGMGRGVRWDGAASAVQPIGLVKPAVGPAITASSSSRGDFVRAVQIVSDGAGYTSEPAVVFSGGTPSTPAAARASIAGGRVTSVVITEPGSGYQSTPSVSFSGGIGTGVTLSVGVLGRVDSIALAVAGAGYTSAQSVTASATGHVLHAFNHGLSAGSAFQFLTLAGGSGLTAGVDYYAVSVGAHTLTAAITAGTTASTNIFSTDIVSGRITIPPPRIVFDSTRGLTDALATISVGANGLEPPSLLFGGTGATTSGVTAAVVGGGGSGAALRVGMQYSVSAVTVSSTGSGYSVPPVITFRPAASDSSGFGAAAEAAINATGNVTAATVTAGGQYSAPPSAIIADTQATAAAELAASLRGKYRCCVRYIDSTSAAVGGPRASSISHLVEVDLANGADAITWGFTHYGLDDRVHAMELWRTSADQSVLLFRVATILRSDPAFSGTYVDTLSDADLTNAERAGYSLMPVTLPSGQINARRFEVPPGEFSVACMFQDRAWYAVDSSDMLPNSLFYSEIDEPESVPAANELVVQENTGVPDRIVALIPLGGYLLIAQQSHLYRLSYVAQPVIDASLILVGYRGILNSACCDVMGGVAFIVDSVGMYAFDGNREEALSVAVDDYWRENVIDFSKASQFHVRCDLASRTVRFFYCKASDSAPSRALCYCLATEAWWEEEYPSAVTATCPVALSAKRTVVAGTAAGTFLKPAGIDDSGIGIPYTFRTGAMALSNADTSRSVDVLYDPTLSDSTLNLGLHYNNSPAPRANAISTDRGSGFVVTQGSTAAQLNLKRSRSSLADATGHARAYYSGRVEDKSSGGDRHVSVALSGTQSGSSPDDAVTVYGVRVEGAG